MSFSLSINTRLPLGPAGRTTIPQLGFGVYLSSVDQCKQSCLTALQAGYRHIDCAQYYNNESQVGEAVAASGVARSHVFLTTKILTRPASVDAAYDSIIDSVTKMSPVDRYVDLFLIHSPHVGPQARKHLWQALERAHAEGFCKAIGVSNYYESVIEEMKEYATVWPPAVNQIELHPFSQQRDTVSYCQSNSILVQAYCPIVRNQRADNATLAAIAKSKGKTANQILLRWSLQKGFVPLPKSDTPSRIEQNANLFGFELNEDEMQRLDGLDEQRAGAICEWAGPR